MALSFDSSRFQLHLAQERGRLRLGNKGPSRASRFGFIGHRNVTHTLGRAISNTLDGDSIHFPDGSKLVRHSRPAPGPVSASQPHYIYIDDKGKSEKIDYPNADAVARHVINRQGQSKHPQSLGGSEPDRQMAQHIKTGTDRSYQKFDQRATDLGNKPAVDQLSSALRAAEPKSTQRIGMDTSITKHDGSHYTVRRGATVTLHGNPGEAAKEAVQGSANGQYVPGYPMASMMSQDDASSFDPQQFVIHLAAATASLDVDPDAGDQTMDAKRQVLQGEVDSHKKRVQELNDAGSVAPEVLEAAKLALVQAEQKLTAWITSAGVDRSALPV